MLNENKIKELHKGPTYKKGAPSKIYFAGWSPHIIPPPPPPPVILTCAWMRPTRLDTNKEVKETNRQIDKKESEENSLLEETFTKKDMLKCVPILPAKVININ